MEYDTHGNAHSSHGPCEAPNDGHHPEDHHFLDNCDNESALPISEEASLLPKPKKGSANGVSKSYGITSSDNSNPHRQQPDHSQTVMSTANAGEEEEPKQSASQIIGVVILEFGVLLHSFVIGLTLAVVERFTTLFIVITLHREEIVSHYKFLYSIFLYFFRNVRRPWLGRPTCWPQITEEVTMGAISSWYSVCLHNAYGPRNRSIRS